MGERYYLQYRQQFSQSSTPWTPAMPVVGDVLQHHIIDSARWCVCFIYVPGNCTEISTFSWPPSSCTTRNSCRGTCKHRGECSNDCDAQAARQHSPVMHTEGGLRCRLATHASFQPGHKGAAHQKQTPTCTACPVSSIVMDPLNTWNMPFWIIHCSLSSTRRCVAYTAQCPQ